MKISKGKRLIFLVLAVAVVCSMVFATCACQNNGPVPMAFDAKSKYGIYWIGEDSGDYVRSSKDMDVKYFDPSKPTFVFAHGWEPDKANSTDGLFEDFVTHKETVSKTGTDDIRDYAAQLKEKGYNVALLSWFSYARDLSRLFKSIWISFEDGYALSTRFAMELAIVLGEDYKSDVKMVGHSYGSQMALATTYQLIEFQKRGMIVNDNIIPTRLTLADPYFGDKALIAGWDNLAKKSISLIGEKLKARTPAKLFADVLESVVDKKDVVADMYFGMSMASTMYYKYDGSDANFEKLSANCAIVNCKGLRDKYGDTNIHNVVRDWTLLSIVDDVTFADAPSGAASDVQIKAMRGKCYNQTYKGFDLAQDNVVLSDRLAGEFL